MKLALSLLFALACMGIEAHAADTKKYFIVPLIGDEHKGCFSYEGTKEEFDLYAKTVLVTRLKDEFKTTKFKKIRALRPGDYGIHYSKKTDNEGTKHIVTVRKSEETYKDAIRLIEAAGHTIHWKGQHK